MDRPLSPTMITMYLRCPRQAYFRYVCNLKIPPKGIMVLGTSVHAGIEEDYREFLKTGRLLSVDDVCDVMLNAFSAESDAVIWEKDEEKPAVLRDDGVKLIKTWKTDRAEKITPLEVESPFECKIGNTLVAGRIDLYDDTLRVVDFKVVSRVSGAQFDTQLGIYATAKSTSAGRRENLVRARVPRVHAEEIWFREPEKRWIRDICEGVQKAFDAGLFPPRCDGGWHCSEKFCGYWSICRS